MANIKSAAKRARIALRRNAINTKTRNSVRTWEKKVRKAIATKNATEAAEILKGFTSVIRKATSKGVIHKATASRKIARISKAIHAVTK